MRWPNYLWSHENPWNLAGPPAWFLAELYAFDPEIVIFPSKSEGVYRVARRVRQNAEPIFTVVKGVPDTTTYVTHSLIPITSLLPFTAWSPVVLSDLADRCIERAGGWAAAADRLDEFDAQEQRRLDRDIEAKASALAHDDWWGIQFRTGGAVSMAHRKRPGDASTTKQRRRNPVYRPLNFAGGSAAFVGATPARTTGRKSGKPRIEPDTYHVLGSSEPPKRSLIVTP